MKKVAAPKNTKWLLKKTYDEKRRNPKKCKGRIKKTSDEKEATLKG
jgi:hypothetical protein